MDLLSVGLVVCDIIAKPVEQNIMLLDSNRIDTLELRPGGDAMNVACNMARLGHSVSLIGRIGCDGFGDFLRTEVAKANVHNMLIADSVFSTSTSIVLIDAQGERHFVYYGKTNDMLSDNDVSDEALRQARHLHIGSAMALGGLDGAGLANLLARAKRFGLSTSLDVTCDATGRWFELVRDALPKADYFMPSLDEAKAISGSETLLDIEAFFKRTGLRNLVIKMGGEGCFYSDFITTSKFPAYQVCSVVDTTGAGDAFVSGFLSGVLSGLDEAACCRQGNYLAARCVETIGAHVQNINTSYSSYFVTKVS